MDRAEVGNHRAKHKICFVKLIDKHISVLNKLIVRKGDPHPMGPDSNSWFEGWGLGLPKI